MILLSERQQRLQTAAIFIAGIAVAIQTYLVGELTADFINVGFFRLRFMGILRKHIKVSAFTGILIETLLMLPFALVFLISWGGVGGPIFGYSLSIWPLLMGLRFCYVSSTYFICCRRKKFTFNNAWDFTIYCPIYSLYNSNSFIQRTIDY